MPTLPQPCLMVLTDRTLLTPNWTLAQAIAPAVTGGANFVLYREADLPPVPRTSVFRFVKDGVRGRVPLLVQGSSEWAMKVGADGVHLEGGGEAPGEARVRFGPDRWVGATVTTLEEAASIDSVDSVDSKLDYVLIYVDWTDPTAALRVVEQYAAVSTVPLVVGPDVPLEQAASCLTAGAAGIAIIEAAMASYDRTGSVRRYAEALGIIPNPVYGT